MNLFLSLFLVFIFPIIIQIESKKNTDFLYDEEFIIVTKQHKRVVRENALFDGSLTTSGDETTSFPNQTSISSTQSTTLTTTTTSTIPTTTTTSTSTQSTSTQSLSTTTLITTTTTPYVTQLYTYDQGFTIKSQFSRLNNRGFYVNLESSPLNIISGIFTDLQVFKNGLVLLSTERFSRAQPWVDFSNANNPLFAPFWSRMTLDANSDVILEIYDKDSSPKSLRNEIAQDINTFVNNGQSTFKPDIIISVTWLNTLSDDGVSRASFQAVFVVDYNIQKTFAIYNYEQTGFTWRSQSTAVLIGFTDGRRNSFVNLFSNTRNPTVSPGLIANSIGNINKRGRFIYDISHTITNKCDNIIFKNTMIGRKLNDYASFFPDYIPCPFSQQQARLSAFYRPYRVTNKLWQERSSCYYIQSAIWLKIFPPQLCCYNQPRGSLNLFGKNSGFMYDLDSYQSLEQILDDGYECCAGNSWTQCRKFYNIFPSTREVFSIFSPTSWTGGDPYIRTFDNLFYTFNGFGEFILARTTSNVTDPNFIFEIHATTAIFGSGTVFTGFAYKVGQLPIIQIQISNMNDTNPYLMLYVNQKEIPDFANDFDFQRDFVFQNGSFNIYRSSETKETTLAFQNGLSVVISIETVPNQVSWLVSSTNSEVLIYDYTNKVEGLMGNFNGIKEDDIATINGTIFTNLNSSDSDRLIYEYAITWTVPRNRTYFVSNPQNPTRDNNAIIDFRPKFLSDFNVSDSLRETCRGNEQCISDALLTNNVEVGKITGNNIEVEQSNVRILNNRAPNITYSQIEIDFFKDNTASSIDVIFKIFDADESDNITWSFEQLNGTNFQLISEERISNTNITVIFRYTPSKGFYSYLNVFVTDSLGATTQATTLTKVCDCKSLNDSNRCDFSTISNTITPQLAFVACNCSSFYTGQSCNQLFSDCLVSKPCDSFSNLYNVTYQCQTLSIEDQIRFNRNYFCNGTCPPGGFTKDEFGFCQDINECLNSTCPLGSTCINTIGAFVCICPAGYQYNPVTNSCDDINECLNPLINKCGSICTNIGGSFKCECYAGYKLSSDNITCVIDIESNFKTLCDPLNCSQICTANLTTNTALCLCNNGYRLQSDGKTCLDINECQEGTNGCQFSDLCSNTIGSFFCSCPIGQFLQTDGRNCLPCEGNTFGLNCSQTCTCNPANTLRCDTIVGCVCKLGFNGTSCEQSYDLCAGKPTYYYSTCVSRPGSFEYICDPGFEKRPDDPFNCYDINECLKSNSCPTNSTCVNTLGSFTCICQTGYNFSNGACVDVNECINSTICPTNAVCFNRIGSYVCECIRGYRLESGMCVDVNECLLNTTCAYNQNCVNLNGSFACVCKPGYFRDLSGTACININECLTNPCGDNQICIDTDGSFICKCSVGYEIDQSSQKCTFKERLVSKTEFHIKFRVPCGDVRNQSWLDNLSTSMINYFSGFGTTIQCTSIFLNCDLTRSIVNDFGIVNVTFSYPVPIKSIDESQIVSLIQSFNSFPIDSIRFINNGTSIVLINSSDICLIYRLNSVCLNGAVCADKNGIPTCICKSYPSLSYSFNGTYCEIRIDIPTSTSFSTTTSSTISSSTTTSTVITETTTSTTTKTSTIVSTTTSSVKFTTPIGSSKEPSIQESTSLVVAIVLPIIAFFMIILILVLIVWMCIRYKRLRRGNENDNQSESTFRIPRISRLFTYAQAPPATLPKAKQQEESSLPEYTFDDVKNQHEATENKESEINKDSNELNINQPQSNVSNPSSSASLSNVFEDEDNNDTARHTHKDESLREVQELDNYIDNLSFGFDDTSEEEEGVVEAINPNVVIPRPKIQLAPLRLYKE